MKRFRVPFSLLKLRRYYVTLNGYQSLTDNRHNASSSKKQEQENKHTEDQPSFATKIKIVAATVSNTVIVISVL